MDFDFELILVLLTFVTGILWLLDILILAPRRKKRVALAKADGEALSEEDEQKLLKLPAVSDFSRSLFPIFLIVMLFRSFVYEPFRIPSGSLEPTLLIGDFILVNKFDYGLRLPVAHTKILPLDEPELGDIMVFRWPENPRIDYIKRVVGVPGDEISYINKELIINGKPATQTFDGYAFENAEVDAPTRPVVVKEEDLMGVKHKIYIRPDVPADNFRGVVVPEGHYFVMGDNRDDSNDSRYWGFVPEENIVGKAVLVWMSWDSVSHKVRFDRIGKAIN